MIKDFIHKMGNHKIYVLTLKCQGGGGEKVQTVFLRRPKKKAPKTKTPLSKIMEILNFKSLTYTHIRANDTGRNIV